MVIVSGQVWTPLLLSIETPIQVSSTTTCQSYGLTHFPSLSPYMNAWPTEEEFLQVLQKTSILGATASYLSVEN